MSEEEMLAAIEELRALREALRAEAIKQKAARAPGASRTPKAPKAPNADKLALLALLQGDDEK